MKTYLLYGAALAILGLAAAPLNGQTQTTTSSSSSGYVQTSKIVGTKVKTAQGEEVGVVKDVVLDRSNGCMAYTVLSAGGTGTRVAGQAKLVAVPWSVYSVSPDMSYLTVSVERDRIYNAPVFEYSRISDTTYTTNVFSHFGVSAGVGVSGATTTTGATTTSGATTQTQTGAYPSPTAAMSASPAASMSPSATVSASAPPTASDAATASAAASASVSPTKATRSKAGATPGSTSTRHKGTTESTQGTGTESSAESAGTPSSSTKSSKKSTSGEKASSAEKSTSAESSAETSGTPSSKKSSKKKSNTEGSETAPTPGGEQE